MPDQDDHQQPEQEAPHQNTPEQVEALVDLARDQINETRRAEELGSSDDS